MNGLYNCSTARFDGSARALTEDELRRAAPSIFATTAHESRSVRFAPIATIDVLRGLQAEGFSPVACRQAVTRQPDRVPFTKHLIRLRRLEDRAYSVGDSVFEITLKNANDGTSAYDLDASLFRIRCLNSLVAKLSTLDTVKVRHSGDVGAKVIDGTYTVLNEAQKLLAAPQDWSQLPMIPEARTAFAQAAHLLRFGDPEEEEMTTPIVPDQLLHIRRRDDSGNDLWTTLNVVQENVIRGGLTAWGRDANNRRRRTTTREIKGIDQDVRLNKALFVLAEKMAGILKSAA